jgi:hypothetical protein
MHSKCLGFFRFKVWEWGVAGVEDFFSFFPGSDYVLFKFPMDTHQVANMFPNMFSIAPHFYPICFGRCCPSFTNIVGPTGRNSILQNRTFTFYFGGASIVSFFWSDGTNKLACCEKKKKIEIGRHPI